VRHGETEWNLTGTQQGHLDSPLTEWGVRQAEALAKGLAGRGIEFIYSSDLGRALRTAEIIGVRLGLRVQTDERLRERHLGALQGITKEEFRRRYPEECARFDSHDPDHCLPGGESARERYERSIACAEDLAGRHSGSTVLLVTHGGILSSFFYKSVGIPLRMPRGFSLFNAAINRFSISGSTWRLDTWGDLSHLGGMSVLDYS